MKNSKKAHTWKQIFQIYWRAIKLLSHVYPQLMISRFLCTVWTALTPYVNIYLSALIISHFKFDINIFLTDAQFFYIPSSKNA